MRGESPQLRRAQARQPPLRSGRAGCLNASEHGYKQRFASDSLRVFGRTAQWIRRRSCYQSGEYIFLAVS